MAIIVIFKLMGDNQRAVLAWREGKEKEKEKEEMQLKDREDDSCPTGSGHFFECACVKNSWANRYRSTRGINVLFTTPSTGVQMVGE